MSVPVLIPDQSANLQEWQRKVKDLVNSTAKRLMDRSSTAERPPNAVDGTLTYNTDRKRPEWWSDADSKWYGGEGPSNLVTKTADYTVLVTDGGVICNKGSTLTLTLLAAATYPGRELMIKTLQAFTVVSASSNVAPIASATLGTAILPATAGAWARLKSDGVGWVVMSRGT